VVGDVGTDTREGIGEVDKASTDIVKNWVENNVG